MNAYSRSIALLLGLIALLAGASFVMLLDSGSFVPESGAGFAA